MKKTLTNFIFTLLLLFSLIIITSCNTQNNNINEHVHDYSNEWTVDKEATCTEDGSKSHHCLTCDAKTDVTPVPATNHSYGEWEVVKEATETSTGLKERECSVCHYIDEEVIPKLDHIHNYSNEWTIDKEATCTEDGSKSHHCLTCDAKTDETIIPATGHNFSQWETILEPTCTEEGIKSHHCLVCEFKENESIDPIDHTYSKYEYDEDNHWQKCDKCNYQTNNNQHNYIIKDNTTLVCICGKEKQIESNLNFTLSEDGNSYMVNGFNGESSEIVIIPNEYNGLPVVSIGTSAFQNDSVIKEIYINEGITKIDSKAFMSTKNLIKIIMPSTLKNISSSTFYNCIRLTNIEIPSSVTSIGEYAFEGCISLIIYCETSSELIDWDPDWNYSNCPVVWDYKNEIDPGGYIHIIIDNIHYGIKDNEAVVLEQTKILKGSVFIHESISYNGNNYIVTTIGDSAFYYCMSLTSIEIPSSVTSIGDYAFYYCMSLTSIEIPSSVTSIGSYAFIFCTSLTSIEIPSSVTSIGSYAFGGELLSLTIYCETSSELSDWDTDWNYSNSPVVWDYKNNDVATDGYIYLIIDNIRYGIKDNEASVMRQSQTLPGNIFIHESISYNCKNYFVTSISDSAFYFCSLMTSTEVPSSVTSIGTSAFYNCMSLTSIEIPSSVTSIGEYAFRYCSSLTIYCEVSSEPSGWYTNWNNSNCPVIWNYKNNDVATDGYIYTVIDNIRYGIKNDEAMVTRQSFGLEGDIVIPQNINYKGKNYSVTSIGASAFYNCMSLTSIEIPSSVTSIGSYAFRNCSSLTSIEIPSSVTSIGSAAFSDCSSLTSIEIPNSVTSIGNYAFERCSSLTIYCEVSSKPSGWDTNWNVSNCPVVWNYKNSGLN